MKRRSPLIGAIFTSVLAVLVLGLFFAGAGRAFDLEDLLDDERRALLVELEFLANGTAQATNVSVSNGPPRGSLGNPPDQLRIETFDSEGDPLGASAAWDPRWGHDEGPDGTHAEDFLDAAIGTIQVPLTSRLDEVWVLDANSGAPVLALTVDVAPAIAAFCTASPGVPACSPPTASAGGPYDLPEDSVVILDASGSLDPGGAGLSYEWDFDGDGAFGEDASNSIYGAEIGVAPAFSAPGAAAGTSFDVFLRVCDSDATCDADGSSVTVVPEPGLATAVYLGLAMLLGLRSGSSRSTVRDVGRSRFADEAAVRGD
jgi:hypothetical protein